jgi:wyosine [tRNA(Phe)-imidazoG37] synthetase (radical SAM superfamily)
MIRNQDSKSKQVPPPTLVTEFTAPASHAAFTDALEVNLFRNDKVCGMNCPHCSLGETTLRLARLKRDLIPVSPQEIENALRAELVRRELGRDSGRYAGGGSWPRLLIAGRGEPTLAQDFPEILKAIAKARQEIAPKTKIEVLTNGERLSDRDVLESLRLADRVWLKLDVGTELGLKRFSKPLSRVTLEILLGNSRKLENLSVLSSFVGGRGGNVHEFEEWLESVSLLAPQQVVMTNGRLRSGSAAAATPARAELTELTEDELFALAHRFERKLKQKALVSFDVRSLSASEPTTFELRAKAR